MKKTISLRILLYNMHTLTLLVQQVYILDPAAQTVRSDTLKAASNSRGVQVQAVIALAQTVHTGLTMVDHRQLTTDALRSTFKCVYFCRQSREARGAGRTTRVCRAVLCCAVCSVVASV